MRSDDDEDLSIKWSTESKGGILQMMQRVFLVCDIKEDFAQGGSQSSSSIFTGDTAQGFLQCQHPNCSQWCSQVSNLSCKRKTWRGAHIHMNMNINSVCVYVSSVRLKWKIVDCRTLPKTSTRSRSSSSKGRQDVTELYLQRKLHRSENEIRTNSNLQILEIQTSSSCFKKVEQEDEKQNACTTLRSLCTAIHEWKQSHCMSSCVNHVQLQQD